ncbi:hypothetical protein BS78_04G165200 [Paspalum vaginatum]|nr:hypothetical protein BS78_04G165200 [Paspalum vaginatum]
MCCCTSPEAMSYPKSGVDGVPTLSRSLSSRWTRTATEDEWWLVGAIERKKQRLAAGGGPRRPWIDGATDRRRRPARSLVAMAGRRSRQGGGWRRIWRGGRLRAGACAWEANHGRDPPPTPPVVASKLGGGAREAGGVGRRRGLGRGCALDGGEAGSGPVRPVGGAVAGRRSWARRRRQVWRRGRLPPAACDEHGRRGAGRVSLWPERERRRHGVRGEAQPAWERRAALRRGEDAGVGVGPDPRAGEEDGGGLQAEGEERRRRAMEQSGWGRRESEQRGI